MLCVTEITLSSSSSQLIDIPQSLIHYPHSREEKSVHLYVIQSPLPLSKAEQSRHRSFLIQEVIVYPKAKHHSELDNNTTFSASLSTQYTRLSSVSPSSISRVALPNIKNLHIKISILSLKYLFVLKASHLSSQLTHCSSSLAT